MRNVFPSLAVALVLSISAPAFGQPYAGIMLGRFDQSVDGTPGAPDPNMNGTTLRWGYQLGDFISAELRGARSASDQGVKIRYLAGAFVRLNLPLPVDERISFYGLGGSTYISESSNAGTDSDESVSYGGGVDLFANRHDALTLEWIRYIDSTSNGVDYTIDHVGIGYLHRF